MDSASIANLQKILGLPPTGVLDTTTYNAMNSAVSKAVSQHPDVKQYGAGSNPDAILNAYMTGNWSGVTDLTGKPFTDEQQKAAVDAATSALAPGFDVKQAYDTSKVQTSLQQNQRNLATLQRQDATQFGKDKMSLDQDAANNGVLYSGSRLLKQNQLAQTYADRDLANRTQAGDTIRSTGRDYAYNYGTDAANKLSSYYNVPGQTNFNPNVAGGKVTPGSSISSFYNPSEYAYQGTQPVANQAAIQTRAAGLLANRANKLSLTGYGTKL